MTSTQMSLQAGTTGISGSQLNKYGGLVQLPIHKVIRIYLSSLFSYIFSESYEYVVMHRIIEFIRILQILGPCLYPSYNEIWSDGSARKTVGVLSIFYKIIPNFAGNEPFPIFVYIYISIFVLYFLILLGMSAYFKRTSNLPSFISQIISFIDLTFGYILHPIAFNGMGIILSEYIFRHKFNLFTVCFTVVVGMAVFLLYKYLYILIISKTIQFRQDSFMITIPTATMYLFTLPCVLGFVSEVSAFAPKIGKIIALIVNIILYSASVAVPFINGGFISLKIAAMFMGTCVTGALLSIITLIFIALDRTLNLIFLFIALFLIIFSIIMSHIIITKIRSRWQIFLDYLAANEEDFSDVIKTPCQLMNIAVEGYRIAHPICVQSKLLKQATNKWPKNLQIWMMLTKFVIIYPEDSRNLSMIFHSITKQKLKGTLARTIKLQIIIILREREVNYSNDLKPKLTNITKKITSLKHKMRHMWDLVLQGNISDMDRATKITFRELRKLEAEFSHLMRQFPNNRFVTRSYSRFCLDIKADNEEYNEMVEKTHLLHRGRLINDDKCHSYGLKAFPNLPDHIGAAFNPADLFSSLEASQGGEATSIDEDETALAKEHLTILKNEIDNMKIPVIRATFIIRWLLVLISFVFPTMFVMLYLKVYVESLLDPLNYMYIICKVREMLYQVVPFSMYFVLKGLDLIPDEYEQPFKPYTLGNSYDIKTQLGFIISGSQAYITKFSKYNSYLVENKYMHEAHRLLFDNNINITHFLNSSYQTSKLSNIVSSLTDLTIQAQALFSNYNENNMTGAIFEDPSILYLIDNIVAIGYNLNNALSFFTEYIIQFTIKTRKIVQTIKYAFLAFSIILHLLLLVIQLVWIKKTKEEAYKALTSLPKNTISVIAENLKMLKKENSNESGSRNNSELNRQEDNVLKILSSGVTANSFSVIDQFVVVFVSITLLAFTVGATLYLGDTGDFLVNRIKQSAPHIDNVNNVYSSIMVTLFDIFVLVAYDNGYHIPGVNIDDYAKLITTRIDQIKTGYALVRFGGKTGEETPFLGFNHQIDLVSKNYKCYKKYSPPKNLYNAARCLAIDIQVYLFAPTFLSIIRPWMSALNTPEQYVLDAKNDLTLSILFSLSVHPQYDLFLGPMFESVLPTIRKELITKINEAILPLSVLIALSILFEICAIIEIKHIEKHIKSTIKLLLHCPADVVLCNSKCMAVISGNFSHDLFDKKKHDEHFYDRVFDKLPNANITIDSLKNVIESMNQQAVRIFGEENIGKTYYDFINMDGFAPKPEDSFKGPCVFKQYNFEIISVKVGNKTVISFMDVTQRIRYNTLIEEERTKSDYMLASILPPSLVKRVQEGETDISFAVQTASILFMDIVSFTPWCSSLPADRVMQTLNMLFKKLDTLLTKYKTITKVKCIGDCYMAAGGVFSEINNPAEHSKEVVSFGLDAIDVIGEVNESLKEKLRIRVGVNTGGPIVAGVLGIGKPTFEILGPAINMAQQMEHNGIPMQVHISRSVYELIYGDCFCIKERGTILIKNGSFVTYLVSRA